MLTIATSGCFDVIHPGHVDLLQRARALGDRLVVLLNSDDSVRRLKGPDKPRHTAEQRTHMLLALRCVDSVLVFYEDTPCNYLCRAAVDIFVKEAEYRDQGIPEEAAMQARGGKVVYLERTVFTSTSDILVKGLES